MWKFLICLWHLRFVSSSSALQNFKFTVTVIVSVTAEFQNELLTFKNSLWKFFLDRRTVQTVLMNRFQSLHVRILSLCSQWVCANVSLRKAAGISLHKCLFVIFLSYNYLYRLLLTLFYGVTTFVCVCAYYIHQYLALLCVSCFGFSKLLVFRVCIAFFFFKKTWNFIFAS